MGVSSNSEIVSLCDTIFMEAGATSSCFPPASAVRYATAVSSASTIVRYFFDIPLKMRNFAISSIHHNYEVEVSDSSTNRFHFNLYGILYS